MGTPDRGARLGGETNGDHLSRCAIGLQWAQTLGRSTAAGGGNAASTRRSACATRSDVSPVLDLHAADRPSRLGGAPRAGLWRGPIALTQHHGRGPQSPGLSAAQGGQGQAPKEDSRDRRHLRKCQKKLGRQNQLEEVCLQRRKIRYGITAEAPTQGPLRAASLPCLPQLLPGTD